MTCPTTGCYRRRPGYRGVRVSSGNFAFDAMGVVTKAICVDGYLSKRSMEVLLTDKVTRRSHGFAGCSPARALKSKESIFFIEAKLCSS